MRQERAEAEVVTGPMDEREPLNVSEDERPQVLAEVDDMVVEFQLVTAADFAAAAEATDKDQARGVLDPHDPPFWRAVAAELRARAAALASEPRQA